MSAAAVRSSRAPPGRRLERNGGPEHDIACPSGATCCMGDAESGLQQDDKYRKRFRQRKQQRLRNGLLALFGSLVLLIFTYVQLSEDDGPRMAHKGERPQHEDLIDNQHMTRELMKERKRKMQHEYRERGGLNDDHNKDDQHGEDDRSHEEKKGWFDKFHNEDAVFQRRLLELEYLSDRIDSNTNTSIRWADMSDVPPLP